MKRLQILMVFGGESSEHDVSVKSAKNVYAAVNKDKHDIKLCYINREGKWWLLPTWLDNPADSRATQVSIIPGSGKVLSVPGNEQIDIDLLFPVLHGKHGEDGSIQGLADMAHIPIVGCDVESSALCMDKHATKLILESINIPVVPWVTVRKGESHNAAIKAIKVIDAAGPWFVKPSRAGSSVGVSRVTDSRLLSDAIDLAHQHDNLALIEVAVVGRELEVAVLGNPPAHKASGVGEIISGSDFYDYDDKYSAGSSSQTLLDAKLPKALTNVIRHQALETYAALGCRGLARVDFLLSDDLMCFVNEVNTLPGFTDISMYPKLWGKKGVSYESLVDRLIELALE